MYTVFTIQLYEYGSRTVAHITSVRSLPILWHVLPVNLLVHPVLLASGSHYIGYQLDNVLFTKLL